MKELRRVLTLILMAMVLSVTAINQTAMGQKNDNRPPKEPQKIKERPKPPPSNSNSQGNTNRHGKS